MKQIASVENIINALSELEDDLDNINTKTEEMKRRLINSSHEQIEHLREKIISLANEEAKRIVDTAKKEAEEESSLIRKEADEELAKIKKNIESSYAKAVDAAVKIILKGKS